MSFGTKYALQSRRQTERILNLKEMIKRPQGYHIDVSTWSFYSGIQGCNCIHVAK